MAITRRDAIGTAACAAAASVLPNVVSPEQLSDQELVALRDKVQAVVDRFHPERENAQFKSVFSMRRSTRPLETYVSVRFTAEEKEEFRDAVLSDTDGGRERGRAIIDRVNANKDRETFRWNIENKPATHSVLVTERDLRRLDTTILPRLVKKMKELRERDAAGIFNGAHLYDPTSGGDGVAICSHAHPHYTGTWSNRLAGDPKLTVEALLDALRRIDTESVDDGGLRIKIRGKMLLVPDSLRRTAERVYAEVMSLDPRPAYAEPFSGLIVWDYLENNDNWFVLTDVDGLTNFEFKPLAMSVAIEKNAVVVSAREWRGFGCFDPRAIYGSLAA